MSTFEPDPAVVGGSDRQIPPRLPGRGRETDTPDTPDTPDPLANPLTTANQARPDSVTPITEAEPRPATPIIEARAVSKLYGGTLALDQVSLAIYPGQVSCVLGDNGAGKSTLIKILAGVHRPSAGQVLVDGRPVRFAGPRQALEAGIATVYQDLATVPLLPVWRNFFLGNELTLGRGPARRLDQKAMKRLVKVELAGLGIELADVNQPIGSLSGGERQSVAIARAIHVGARALILDEPTAALGVKQSEIVLRHVRAARASGLGIAVITHNPQHAYLVGDRFLILNHGRSVGDYVKSELTLPALATAMAGDPIELD